MQLRMEQIELLPQLLPRIFKRGGVVSPVGPARGDGHDDRVQESPLPQVLENLRVFVILEAIPEGLQTHARCRFR